MKETQSLLSWGLPRFRGDGALIYTTRQTGLSTVRSKCVLWGGARAAAGTQEGSEDKVTSLRTLKDREHLNMKRWREGSNQNKKKKKLSECFFHITLDNLLVIHPEENGHGSGALDLERGGKSLTGEPLGDPGTLRVAGESRSFQ